MFQGQIPIWTTCQMLSKRKKYQTNHICKFFLQPNTALWDRAPAAMKYNDLFGTAGDSQESKEKGLNPPGPQLQGDMVSKFQTASSDEADTF